MLKYIKWELFALAKKYWKFIVGILALYFIVSLMPVSLDDESIITLIYIPFIIVLVLLFFGAFFFGTKKVVDSFRKKTFLLESMIASSPYKILLAKYLIAIIVNMACVILFVIGMAVAITKAVDIEFLVEMFEEVLNIGIGDWLKVGVTLILSTVSFTALITLCYVIAKCLMPNGKGSFVIGAIVWYIINYITSVILDAVTVSDNTTAGFVELGEFVFSSCISFILIGIYYFITVKLIENKLEIYN